MLLCPQCFQKDFDGTVCKNCHYQKENDTDGSLAYFHLLNNRYLTGRTAGRGGFGITYAAYDCRTNSRKAVKEYFPLRFAARNSDGAEVICKKKSDFTEFQKGINFFQQEAEILKNLKDIDGVVSITDFFEENKTAYYVMEYLDGVTLKTTVGKGGLNPKLAFDIIMKAGRTLDLLHREKKIIHRDISPENMIILPSGRVVLIDFGSARCLNSDDERPFVLKHSFAPIEQYSKTGVQGEFTDLYALAATYYYALTKVKIPRASDRLSGAAYIPLCELKPGLSAAVSAVVDRALMVDPSDRTKTVGEFLTALQTAVSQNDENCRKYWFIICIDNQISRKISIMDNSPVTIGKSKKDCDIYIENCGSISDIHCMIWFDSRKKMFCIRDCSRNGTYINHKRILSGINYDFGSKDIIHLANARCKIIPGSNE